MITIIKRGEIIEDQKIYPEYDYKFERHPNFRIQVFISELKSLIKIYRNNKEYLIPFRCTVENVSQTDRLSLELLQLKHKGLLLDKLIDESTNIIDNFSIDDPNIDIYKYE